MRLTDIERSEAMFESERLIYRPYTMDDLDFYASLWADERVVRYIGFGLTKNRTESEYHLREWVLPRYRDGLGLYMLVHKSDGQPIGHAGLIPQQVDGEEEIEIGYWLKPDYWGRGLAKEAAVFFKKYGFRTLHLRKLISLINPNNPASIFVARKNGMYYERTVDFHGHPTLVYSVHNRGGAEDWSAFG